MPERNGRFNRLAVLKAAGVLAITLACMCTCGCTHTVARVRSYDEFLRTYTQYGAYAPPSCCTEISGFTALTDRYFAFGTPFCGGYAFVQTENGYGLLDISGNVTNVPCDLSSAERYGAYYVYEQEGKKGVKSALAGDVLPPVYDEVCLYRGGMAAVRGDRAESYAGGALIAETRATRVYARENCLWADGRYCDAKFDPLTACGYRYADVPSEGVAVVDTGDGAVRYAHIERQTFLGGTYVQARNFCEGTGVAIREDGATEIVDIAGNVLCRVRGKVVGDGSDGLYCYEQNGRYGVMDAFGNDRTDKRFASVRYEKPVAGYLIVRFDAGERLFDIAADAFTDTESERIAYENGVFFCVSGGEVTLRDTSLGVIARAASAAWGENVLTLRTENGYAYYVREENER